MNTILRVSVIAVLALLALPASARQRTFVASYGDDLGSCDLTAPCRTFTRAMTQTDHNGEVIVLDSAGYGAFTITQSVSVIAPEGVYAGISVFPGQHGIVANGAGINVTLRGLTLNGQGGDDGIRIENAGRVFIQKVVVANTGNDNADAAIRIVNAGDVLLENLIVANNGVSGIRIEGGASIMISSSVIRGNFVGPGIAVVAGTPKVSVKDTWIARNGNQGVLAAAGELRLDGVKIESNFGTGLQIAPPASTAMRVSVHDSEFSDNGAHGVNLVPTAAGASVDATVERSRALRNTEVGFQLFTGTSGTGMMRITGSASSNNGLAGVNVGGSNATVFVSGSTVTGSLFGLGQADTAVLNSCGDNKVFGNGSTTPNVTATACDQ